jgi:L-fuconolactonase
MRWLARSVGLPRRSADDFVGALISLDGYIVDCHAHVVAPDHERYPLSPAGLPGDSWVEEAPVSHEQLLAEMDVAGVAAALLVQPVGAYGTDNSYASDAAAAEPSRFGGVAVIDMTATDRVETLKYWVRDRGLRGLRLFSIPTPEPGWLDNPATHDIWRAADRLRVRMSVALLPVELDALAAVLAKFPHHRVMLDHCGFAGLDELAPLAAHQHLYLKVTTNVLDAASDPRDFVDGLVASFGASRLAWGSDYSQTHDRSYTELVELASYACSRLATPDRERFLGGTALELWPELS